MWLVVVSWIAGALLLLIAWKVYRLPRSPFHTFRSATVQLFMLIIMRLLGRRQRKKFEADSKRAGEVMEETLMDILKRNTNTQYGRDHQFDRIKNKKDFKESQPLTRYSNYEPYIEKIMKGEQHVMSTSPFKMLGTTAGTSGSSKKLPMVRYQSFVFFMWGITLVYDTIMRNFRDFFSLQRSFKIMYEPSFQYSEGGVKIGPNSSAPSDSPALLNMYSTPKEVFTLSPRDVGYDNLLYLHVLFALKDKELGVLECNFVHMLYDVFVRMESDWELLVSDIEHGKLNEKLQLPQDVRDKVNKLLKPDKRRAQELRKEFTNGFLGIAQRIWPRVRFVLSCDTGSFALYAEKLRARYLAPVLSTSTTGVTQSEIPIYSPLYAATEGLIGVAMDVCVIPLHEEQPSVVVDVREVELGKQYELAITTYSGLTRYRFGDVVKIHSFYNQCPVIEFQYRQGQLMNLRGEKTTEIVISEAVHKTIQACNLSLTDYTCLHHTMVAQSDKLAKIPRYFVVMELETIPMDFNLKQVESVMDDSISQCHYPYLYHRQLGTIGSASVIIVKNGTFAGIANLLRTLNSAPNQVKIPRVALRPDVEELLLANVLLSSLQ